MSLPIRRTPQLAPYSREHHEGLKVAARIRHGLSSGIAPARIGAYLLWFWEQHLQAHFRSEEALLQPLLSAQDPLLVQMLEEHEELEALVHIHAQIADGALLQVFSEKLHDHIRFEERSLFPHIERQASPEQLDAVLRAHGDLPACAAWEDPFWLPQA